MAAVIAFTFIGCKKNGTDNYSAKENDDIVKLIKSELQKNIKEQGGTPLIIPLNIPVQTYLSDEKNNPVTYSSYGVAAPCNFTTPAYCNLLQYARTYDCTATGTTDGGYYLQFTYRLSWDNSIYTRASQGYLKIYDAATNALVVNDTIIHFNIQVLNLGTDPANSGNNIYEVTFRDPKLIASGYINGGTSYSVYTSALFGTTCSNGTNYFASSAAVTSSSFTGASGNDPCKRNEKTWFSNISSTQSGYIAVYTSDQNNTCSAYNTTFIPPDVQEAEYSTDGGATFNGFHNIYAGNFNNTKFLKSAALHIAESAYITPGTYNVVIRYKNWKYTSSQPTYPIPVAVGSGANACTVYGNQSAGNYNTSGYTYDYFPNLVIQ